MACKLLKQEVKRFLEFISTVIGMQERQCEREIFSPLEVNSVDDLVGKVNYEISDLYFF